MVLTAMRATAVRGLRFAIENFTRYLCYAQHGNPA